MPEAYYIGLNGKIHRYYVDIFIPKLNMVIEVKSYWTYEKDKNVVHRKLNTFKYMGFHCELRIYENEKCVCTL